MPPLLAETKTIDLFIRKVNDMISANNISLRVGKKALFEDVKYQVYRRQLLWTDRCKRRRKVYIFKDPFRTVRANQR